MYGGFFGNAISRASRCGCNMRTMTITIIGIVITINQINTFAQIWQYNVLYHKPAPYLTIFFKYSADSPYPI